MTPGSNKVYQKTLLCICDVPDLLIGVGEIYKFNSELSLKSSQLAGKTEN